jgi:hypothetical protein
VANLVPAPVGQGLGLGPEGCEPFFVYGYGWPFAFADEFDNRVSGGVLIFDAVFCTVMLAFGCLILDRWLVPLVKSKPPHAAKLRGIAAAAVVLLAVILMTDNAEMIWFYGRRLSVPAALAIPFGAVMVMTTHNPFHCNHTRPKYEVGPTGVANAVHEIWMRQNQRRAKRGDS